MPEIDRDWKITVEMVFQYAAEVTGSDSDLDNFELIDSVEAKIYSPDDFLYVDSEDAITSGDYEFQGKSWDYSDVAVNVVLEAENGTLSEVKKVLVDQLLAAKFAFIKDKRIKVEFHSINRWVFAPLEDSSDEPTYILGGLLPEGGDEMEFEKEIFGDLAQKNSLWQMDEIGRLYWEK